MHLSLASAWHALRFGSTLPTRCGLALAAALFSITLLMAAPEIASRPSFAHIAAGDARYWWAAIFGIDAILIICRIVDTRARIGIARIVNALTCGLWFGYVAATTSALGYLSPDDAAEISLAIASAWCALRTDLTVNDRETA